MRRRELDTDWLVDESGNIAAQFTYRDDKKHWEIRTRKERHWTLVGLRHCSRSTRREMLGFNADGSGIIVRFMVNGDPEWRPLNLSDNTWGLPLAQGAAFSRIIEDRKTGRIIGGIHRDRQQRIRIFRQ